MTRATAFGNRTISGQRREDREAPVLDRADDSEARDSQEMAAMAKVWAHPEDLHKYPVTPCPSYVRHVNDVHSARRVEQAVASPHHCHPTGVHFHESSCSQDGCFIQNAS